MSQRKAFNAKLREFAVAEIDKPGNHDRTDIADRFLAEHPDLAAAYIRDLAVKKIADLIKDLCDEPADFGQLKLFGGFPNAIAVADGVVKSTRQCTLDDLGAGLEYRRLNVTRAQDSLRAYGESMAAFEALRVRDDETVGEVADRVQQPKDDNNQP